MKNIEEIISSTISSYINDFSNSINFNDDEIIDIEEELVNEYENGGEQIVIIIIKNTEGKSLKSIGTSIFNKNGFGRKEENNGILLLISEEEKKLRIIVGKGIKNKYTIPFLRKLVEGKLRPLLNKGEYTKLIKLYKEEIIKRSNLKGLPLLLGNSSTSELIFFWGILIITLSITIIILLVFIQTLYKYISCSYMIDKNIFYLIISSLLLSSIIIYRFRENFNVIKTFIISIILLINIFGMLFYLVIKDNDIQQTIKEKNLIECKLSLEKNVNNINKYDNNDDYDYDYDSTSIGGGGSTDGYGYGD